MDDCLRFQSLTSNKNFASIVKKIKSDELCPNEFIVELSLIDVSGSTDVYIDKMLIDEKRAISSIN